MITPGSFPLSGVNPFYFGKIFIALEAIQILNKIIKGQFAFAGNNASISGKRFKILDAEFGEKDEPPITVISPGCFCFIFFIKYSDDVSWHRETENPARAVPCHFIRSTKA